MKRIFTVLTICLLIMCSCEPYGKNKPEDFFQSENVLFSFEGTRYFYNSGEHIFLQTDGSFEGMKIRITEQGCDAVYGDYVLSTEFYAFSALKSFDMMWEAFNNSVTETVIADDGAFVLIVDSSRFLVYYNKDSEIVSKLVAETVYGVFEYVLTETEEES